MRFSTPVLIALIVIAPVALVIAGGGEKVGETGTFALVMVSVPILLGVMAQRWKGRTGAVWWLLATILIVVVNVLAGGGSNPDVLAKTLLFGAVPIAIIIATFPRRSAVLGVQSVN